MKERKSIRLQGYDYSSDNLYFVTSCVQNRVCCFGNIVGTGRDPSMHQGEYESVGTGRDPSLQNDDPSLQNDDPSLQNGDPIPQNGELLSSLWDCHMILNEYGTFEKR
jgi:putative transposase